jgi:hypothetical protein
MPNSQQSRQYHRLKVKNEKIMFDNITKDNNMYHSTRKPEITSLGQA